MYRQVVLKNVFLCFKWLKLKQKFAIYNKESIRFGVSPYIQTRVPNYWLRSGDNTDKAPSPA